MKTRDELIFAVARIDHWGARGVEPAVETATRIVDYLIDTGQLTVEGGK